MTNTEIKAIETSLYHAVPALDGSRPRHAITTHMPGWLSVQKFVTKDPKFLGSVVDIYPRVLLHRDVKKLTEVILSYAKATNQAALLFPSLKYAQECLEYATQPKRADGYFGISADLIEVRFFLVGKPLFAVFFPSDSILSMMVFWRNAGVGISSRLAEEALNHVHSLRELRRDELTFIQTARSPSTLELLKRIADLMNRARADISCSDLGNDNRPFEVKVRSDDVYVFQTGMAAIYNTHKILQKWQSSKTSKTIQIGLAFKETLQVFWYWGAGLEFFPHASNLGTVDEFLQSERDHDRSCQAIWTEVPGNPLLCTADLIRLREIADRYGLPLVIDDTIGSFCNIDVLFAADVVVTSLTKSFSGYADVMGGSAVLNKSSPLYAQLKQVFEAEYEDNLYPADAETLFLNSTDYLKRSAILNNNALKLAGFLAPLQLDPGSSVLKVYYPSLCSDIANYAKCMRASNNEFIPGFGCLLTIEFRTLERAVAFYENLHFHQSPHLGAHRTLALAYSKLVFHEYISEVEKWGANDRQIRISVGLEATEVILATVKHALRFADEVGK